MAATRRSVYIHQMNRVNPCTDLGHDDSTINIVIVIIIIIIIVINSPTLSRFHRQASQRTSGRTAAARMTSAWLYQRLPAKHQQAG